MDGYFADTVYGLWFQPVLKDTYFRIGYLEVGSDTALEAAGRTDGESSGKTDGLYGVTMEALH